MACSGSLLAASDVIESRHAIGHYGVLRGESKGDSKIGGSEEAAVFLFNKQHVAHEPPPPKPLDIAAFDIRGKQRSFVHFIVVYHLLLCSVLLLVVYSSS